MKIPQLTIILTLFLGFLSTEGSGQSTFNIRWYYEAESAAMNVWEMNDKYYVQGVHFDNEVIPQKFGFLSERDSDGQELSSMSFGSPSEQYQYNLGFNVCFADTTVILLPCEINDTLNAALIWLNPEGEVFRQKFIPSPYADSMGEVQSDWLSFGDLRIDSSGELTFVVNIFNDIDGGAIYINRLNFQGEVIWQSTIDSLGYHDVSFALHPLDEGMLGIGTRYDVSEYESFLYEVDDFGNIIELYELESEGGFVFDLIIDDNGITSASRKFLSMQGFKGYILNSDISGALDWDVTLGDYWGLNQEFRHIRPTSDGNYVALGKNFELDPIDPDVNGNENWHAWLIKFSANGNILWDRKYSNISSLEDEHFVTDIKPTSDGGYIFTGLVQDNSNSPDAMNPSQQAWLVKVDEHGCLVPGCHVSIDEQDEVSYFTIGPNPVTESLNVFIRDYGLSNSAQLQIHDLQGKLIETSSVRSNVTYLLDVSNYPQGAYTVTLLDHDVKYSEVVLVE